MAVTAEQIADKVAALMNDTEKGVYTFEKVLPYLNMAMNDLQEIFEQNNVPVTDKLSFIIKVNASTNANVITELTALPADLVEIQQLWESARDLNQWTLMNKWQSFPQFMLNAPSNMLIGWVYADQKILLIPSNADNDIKMEYLGSLFTEVANKAEQIKVKNVQSYLQYHTAALCSMFVGENETRATALEEQASNAMDRSLGISTKGRQSLTIRRRPFMASYKRRAVW